jgi:Fur family transcriptional regulator, iron response regulator
MMAERLARPSNAISRDGKMAGEVLSQVSRPAAGLPEGHADHMAACPVHALRGRLRRVGLRPTRQRVALGWLLFGKGDRHITAEKLYEEATSARVAISLATVYNTLHQFTEAGLLREIAVDGSKTYFDTNTTHHHHFLIGETNTVLDIPGPQVSISDLPEPPEGMEIDRVEVVVRLRKKAPARRAAPATAS